jgi:hypothetical protein
MEAATVLAQINEQHGRAFSLVGKCEGGTRGAYEVAEGGSQRAILKFGAGQGWLTRLQHAESIAAPLRAVGYPTPRNLALGTAPDDLWYQIQEFIPGAPMPAPLSPTNLEILIALNDLQANRHPDATEAYPNWSSYIRGVVFANESGWAGALQNYSQATQELLAVLQSTAAAYADAELPTTDIVHGDFLPGNVLVHDGRLAAVIDTMAMGYGTRVHDLARVLVWLYDDMAAPLRQQLAERIAAISTPAVRTICLIGEIIDVVAFMIEHHPRAIERHVQNGWAILNDLDRQGAVHRG